MSIDTLRAALADRYTIERELGRGGMATVYLAHDIKHGRDVAIKVLHAELSAILGPERFLKEIELTASLQHPHILPLFDSGSADGLLCYVMPFVAGESLRDRLTREKQLPVADALRIASEVADALDYAHQRGVIHRDIKPENILLQNGHALVADFGIALAVQQAGGTRMTQTGLSLGTPQYMSPEQAMGEREIGPRSDIYSLGAVTYEMLAGEPPFTGPTAQAIVARVMTEEPRSLMAQRKSVPFAVDHAVRTALEKLPADRFATAAAFSAELAATSPHIVSGHGRSANWTRPWMVWAAAAVALAAVIVAVAATRGSRGTSTTGTMRFLLTSPADGIEPGESTISPDGRTVVFVGANAGASQLYRRSLDDLAAVPLQGTDGADEPVFSPDGRWIAFAAPDRTIRKVSVNGGPVTTVLSTTEPAGMSWSARYGLVLGMPAFSSTVHGLGTVSAAGDSGLHPLTRPSDTVMNHYPYVIPGDAGVAYSVVMHHGNALGVGALTGKSWTSFDLPVGRVVGVAQGILFYQRADDGRLMAVTFDLRHLRPVGDPVAVSGIPADMTSVWISSNGTLAILRQSRAYQMVLVDDHGIAQTMLPDTISRFYPRFSPSGANAALVGDFRGTAGAWTFDFGARTLTRLQLGGDRVMTLTWTPDGQRIVAARLGGGGVLWQAADGRDSATVLIHAAKVVSVAVSPDGETLAIGTGFDVGGYNIMTRALHGDTALKPFAATSANEVAPAFAPDGRWLAYASDQSGRYEVYVRAFPGPGPLIHVSDSGGAQPVWSHDGRHIYYRAGRAVMLADVAADATGALQVTARHHLFDGDFFGADAFNASTFDVAPDGRHLLMARAVTGGHSELVMWTNWLGAVRQQLDTPR